MRGLPQTPQRLVVTSHLSHLTLFMCSTPWGKAHLSSHSQHCKAVGAPPTAIPNSAGLGQGQDLRKLTRSPQTTLREMLV